MPSVNTLRPSKTLDVATRSYQAGAGDYLTVLTAQRSLWSAQESLISLQQTDLENRITLWQSLGVGLSNACGAIRTRGEEKIHTFGWRRYTECNDIFLGKHVSLNGGFDEICTPVCLLVCLLFAAFAHAQEKDDPAREAQIKQQVLKDVKKPARPRKTER